MKKAAGGAEASSEQQGAKEEQQDQWIKKQSWENLAISPGLGTACATPATVPGKTHSPCSSPRQSPMCHHHSIQSSREQQQEPQIVKKKKIISDGMQQSGNQATGMLAGMAFEHWTTRHTSLKHGGQTSISSLLCTAAALPASQRSSHSMPPARWTHATHEPWLGFPLWLSAAAANRTSCQLGCATWDKQKFCSLEGKRHQDLDGGKKQNQKKTILSESTKLTPPHTHTASSCPSVLFTAPRPSNTQPTDCFACLKQCPVWPSTSYTHSKH